MKKIFKYLVLCLFLTSCGFSTTNYYYEKIDSNGDLQGEAKGYNFDSIEAPWIKEKFLGVDRICFPKKYTRVIESYKLKNGYKEYCSYTIGPIPLNFATTKEYHAKYIKKAIKELNQEGRKGKAMKNILISDVNNIYKLFILKSRCIIIIGELIDE
jgi:hypothetical protein